MSTSYTLSRKAGPKASQSGVGLTVDVSQLQGLARDLRRAAPEAWKVLRTELRLAAKVVAEDAKGRASFSTRIPGSIKVRGSGASLKVVAGGSAAPDAAPIENKGRGGVRHPVFGNRNVWTSKNSPTAFLYPALNAHRSELETRVARAVERAVVDGLGAR